MELALLAIGVGWAWAPSRSRIDCRPGSRGAIGRRPGAWLVWRELGGDRLLLWIGLVPILVMRWTAVTVRASSARGCAAAALLAVVSLLALGGAPRVAGRAPVRCCRRWRSSGVPISAPTSSAGRSVAASSPRGSVPASPGRASGAALRRHRLLVALAIAWVTGPSTEILSSRLAEQVGVAAMVAGLTALVALSIVGDLYESLAQAPAGVKDSGAAAARPRRHTRPHRCAGTDDAGGNAACSD